MAGETIDNLDPCCGNEKPLRMLVILLGAGTFEKQFMFLISACIFQF